MKLASILDPKKIICNVPVGSREEIYLYILKQATEFFDLEYDCGVYVKQMMDSEDMMNIPYEGVVIPHLRLPELNDLHIIVGLLAEPVMLKESDLKPTQIVVMSLISNNTSDIYLKALSAFTRYFSQSAHLENASGIATAEEFIALLERDKVELKKDITAEDVMYSTFLSLKPDDKMKVALNTFTGAATRLPVLDDDGKLIGVLNSLELIKVCVPEYIMMMDNINFLSSFEPFQKIIDTEDNATVQDNMTKPQRVISPDTPLIQLTISLVKKEAETIFVVDEQRRLLGVITLENLIHKVLRG
ncbi:MAG: PTS sugar transporter subunit IIA [Victivallaceae bacterium]|nr:PTS sugar transporter subunit IIA [Victivallaceae bacterium]